MKSAFDSLVENLERGTWKPKEPTPESSSIPPESTSPVDDPAEWRATIVEWLDSSCALHPRCFGAVNALHLAFCEWEIARDEVPCDRQAFERMLSELGFLMGDVNGELLVSGVTFREDLLGEFNR
jgi:hypothetical protein